MFDEFDADAFWRDCERDLAAARAKILRAKAERDHYRQALQRVELLLLSPAMRGPYEFTVEH